MFLFTSILDDGSIDSDALVPVNGDSSDRAVSAPLFTSPNLRKMFKRVSTNSDLGIDLGSNPNLKLLIKQFSEADNERFDGPILIPSPTFTRVDGGSTIGFYYEGSPNLAHPALLKLMGVDPLPAKESLTVATIADVAGSLNGRYWDLALSDTTHLRLYYRTLGHTDSPPSAGTGGTLVKVTIAEDSDADDVASETVTVINTNAVYAGSVGTEDFTITAVAFGSVGAHDIHNTGFTLTILTAGADGLGVPDVASLDLAAQFVWTDGTAVGASPIFTLTVVNTLYRPPVVPEMADTLLTRSGDPAIGNGTDTVTVSFSTAFPAGSTWRFRDGRVKNTVDVSPLVLFAGTVTAISESGFTLKLNGNTDSANYTFPYIVDRNP